MLSQAKLQVPLLVVPLHQFLYVFTSIPILLIELILQLQILF